MFAQTRLFDTQILGICKYLGIKDPQVRSKSIWIYCPLHQEKNERSFNFARDTGLWYCFGCGKGGGFRKLRAYFGLEEDDDLPTNADIDPFQILGEQIKEFLEEGKKTDVILPIQLRPIPPRITWRDMPGKFLAKLGGQLFFDPIDNIERVWFPIVQQKELCGWVGRIRRDSDLDTLKGLVKEAKQTWKRSVGTAKESKRKGIYKDLSKRLQSIPRYRHSPGMQAQELFFPFDYVIQEFGTEFLVLVEGPIDALYLIYNGFPALSIQGTNNWSQEKEALLLSQSPKRIILSMDGDRAGRQARREIRESLSPYVECRSFRPPDGIDPALFLPGEFIDLQKVCLRGLR